MADNIYTVCAVPYALMFRIYPSAGCLLAIYFVWREKNEDEPVCIYIAVCCPLCCLRLFCLNVSPGILDAPKSEFVRHIPPLHGLSFIFVNYHRPNILHVYTNGHKHSISKHCVDIVWFNRK